MPSETNGAVAREYVEGPLPCGEDLDTTPISWRCSQATTWKAGAAVRHHHHSGRAARLGPRRAYRHAAVPTHATCACWCRCTLAWTENRGLPGYVDGLQLVDVVLQTFWDDVHPRVVDGWLRRPAAAHECAGCTGRNRRVRDAACAMRALLDDGGVTMSLRQVEALLDSSKADQIDYPGGIGRLREAVRRAHDKGDAAGASPCCAALGCCSAFARPRERALGQSWAPDFSRLERSLRTVVQLLPEKANERGRAQPAVRNDGTTASEAGRVGLGAQARTAPLKVAVSAYAHAGIKDIEISSRDDVQVLLEKACQYLERAEPSHPAPMLIRRAQRLLDLNFFQIIEELVPEGLQKIESLAGRPLPTHAGASRGSVGRSAPPPAFSQFQEEAIWQTTVSETVVRSSSRATARRGCRSSTTSRSTAANARSSCRS